MKVRITYIHDPAKGDWDPAKGLNVTDQSLKLTGLHASAREDHFTLHVDELPRDLWRSGLQHADALHIRYQADVPASPPDPYGSRTVPGLHVFYRPSPSRHHDGVPEGAAEAGTTENICVLLRKLFPDIARCSSPSQNFNAAPALSTQLVQSPSLQQYYQLGPDLEALSDYVLSHVCGSKDLASKKFSADCRRLASSLAGADSLDIDYDVLSSTVVLRALHYSNSDLLDDVDESIPSLPETRVEVGILALEDDAPGMNTGEEDDAVKISMGGLLTRVGEEDKPSRALFSFPSRHHSTQTEYNVRFDKPTGLHPTLRINFPGGTPRPPANTARAGRAKTAGVEDGGRTCALFAHLSLPSYLFPDKYQLAAPNFLAANNLRGIRSLTEPPPDLEAPDWAVEAWGSAMLVELAVSFSSSASTSPSWDAQIPLHLRYLQPAPGGQRQVDVAWPAVFWACSSRDGSKMGVNPFDREELGYTEAFGPRTVFYHLSPQRLPGTSHNGTSAIREAINVPVLDESSWAFRHVRQGTAIVIIAGLIWIMWKLIYVTITNREAGSIGRMAMRERVDVPTDGSKEKAQ